MTESRKKPIRVYSYLRVSTSMQVEGFSLDAQRQRIKDYADYEKMIIVKEYADEGISGKNIENRISFKQMLKDIETKKDGISFVLVFKLSRFGRNAADVLSSLQKMQDYGVNLICVDDKIDSSIDSGKLMISIMAAMAEIERENIRAFTMAGRRQKAQEGGWNGGFAPYGYKLENGKLYIENDEADIIRTIFDMYVNENFGLIGLANRLNALGIRKKIKRKNELDIFTPRFLTMVIDNPIYKGYIAFGRRKTEKIEGERNQYHVIKETDEKNIIVVKGKHEAIVSEELWEKAKQKRSATGGRKEKLEKEHEYILSGLVCCPYCGKHMYGVPSKKKKESGEGYSVSYAYLCRNNNKARGNVCPHPHQYNCKDIDEQVAKVVIWQLNRTEVLENMAKQAYKEFDVFELQDVIDKSENKIKALLQKKDYIRKKIDTLDMSSVTFEGMFEVLGSNLETVVGEIVELEKIIEEYEAKIKNVKDRERQWNTSLNYMLQMFSDYDEYSDYKKKKLMQSVVKNIEIYPEKRAYGYLKSIEFAFPVFKSHLTDEMDTIYTVQDAYPNLLDENGEMTDYDTSEGREVPQPKTDENGCVVAYPDETEYFMEYGCLPPDHLRTKESIDGSRRLKERWEEYLKEKNEEEGRDENFLPKEKHDESVALLVRK